MTKFENAVRRLKSKPKDLKYDEVTMILKHLGYIEDNKGKTSGSRVRFYNPLTLSIINMHKPHGSNCLTRGAVEDLVSYLREKGLI